MLFKRKPTSKDAYDQQLLSTMQTLQSQWKNYQRIKPLIEEESMDAYAERKLAEAKYFYLFKEAKIREIQAVYTTDF